jgi:hypothetical protein
MHYPANNNAWSQHVLLILTAIQKIVLILPSDTCSIPPYFQCNSYACYISSWYAPCCILYSVVNRTVYTAVISTNKIHGDRKVAHIKLKVVINCIAVNIIRSPTARWYCRSTNNE